MTRTSVAGAPFHICSTVNVVAVLISSRGTLLTTRVRASASWAVARPTKTTGLLAYCSSSVILAHRALNGTDARPNHTASSTSVVRVMRTFFDGRVRDDDGALDSW